MVAEGVLAPQKVVDRKGVHQNKSAGEQAKYLTRVLQIANGGIARYREKVIVMQRTAEGIQIHQQAQNRDEQRVEGVFFHNENCFLKAAEREFAGIESGGLFNGEYIMILFVEILSKPKEPCQMSPRTGAGGSSKCLICRL
jgi:hypothetical protein